MIKMKLYVCENIFTYSYVEIIFVTQVVSFKVRPVSKILHESTAILSQ